MGLSYNFLGPAKTKHRKFVIVITELERYCVMKVNGNGARISTAPAPPLPIVSCTVLNIIHIYFYLEKSF